MKGRTWSLFWCRCWSFLVKPQRCWKAALYLVILNLCSCYCFILIHFYKEDSHDFCKYLSKNKSLKLKYQKFVMCLFYVRTFFFFFKCLPYFFRTLFFIILQASWPLSILYSGRHLLALPFFFSYHWCNFCLNTFSRPW